MFCPDRAKWAPQGPRRRMSVRSRRPDLPPIGVRVMAPCGLRWILSTQSRSPLQMQRFEPSIDLDFANGFFEKKVGQLNNIFFKTFLPSSMRPRHTVEMQRFELVAILVATSDLLKLFWGARRAPGDFPGRGKRSVFAPSLCARVAKQNVFIFTMDSVSPRPPTP